MSDQPTEDELRARIAALEAENARLQLLAAAAREALAVFEGRRPGFAPDYARDILRAAFAADPVALVRPLPRRGRGRSRRK
ncbi:MAG: hypothetical protein OHK0022_17740 [Roseiflexaceae bacterium]